MKKSTRSILQELNNINIKKDIEFVIENRASNIIQSAIHLLELIKENYNEEVSLDLERRFINSIKGSDFSKFQRGIKKIKENKH